MPGADLLFEMLGRGVAKNKDRRVAEHNGIRPRVSHTSQNMQARRGKIITCIFSEERVAVGATLIQQRR